MNLLLHTDSYNKYFITLVVVISPPSPDGVYTVEVQRTLIITCTGANPDDIVAWIRKHSIVAILLCSILFFLCTWLFLYTSHTAVGLDPSQVVTVPTNTSNQESGCLSPEPFLQNTNSNEARLIGDDFNGTQPEDADNYTCYANGVPRASVEVIVLGELVLQTMWYLHSYNFTPLISAYSTPNIYSVRSLFSLLYFIGGTGSSIGWTTYHQWLYSVRRTPSM